MKKELLTAAIGAAFAATPMLAAPAEVKVYGMAQVEVSGQDVEFAVNNDGVAGCSGGAILTCTGFDGVAVEDRARGRIGIGASEDLGDGLKGIAKFEFRIDTTDEVTGAGTTADREAMLGLEGKWGTLQAGNLRSAYKYTGGVKYDAFVATTLEARGNGGMSGSDLQTFLSAGSANTVRNSFGHNNFLNNSVAYLTPKLGGGLKLWLTYSPDENGNARGSEGDWSAALSYGKKKWEVFVATVNMDQARTSGLEDVTAAADSARDYSSIKVGGKVKLGPHTFLAQFETAESDFVGIPRPAFLVRQDTDKEFDAVFLGYQLRLKKNNTIVLQVGQTEWDGTVTNMTDADVVDALAGNLQNGNEFVGVDPTVTYVAIGLIHKFSKKFRVFVGYRQTEFEDLTAFTSTIDGQTSGAERANSDPTDTAFSLGIRMDF